MGVICCTEDKTNLEDKDRINKRNIQQLYGGTDDSISIQKKTVVDDNLQLFQYEGDPD